ncbi:MAG: NAD-dependent DNA ligase LigA [Lachnospiraceae bacterium]|nr:NAD-dependent DNA ligase LigA [Lachnospiraceae bacterium]
MEKKTERIKELVKILNEASKAYYQDSSEIMSNFEYDRLYDELTALENETGMVLSNSPSIHVGYEVLSQLPKETHASPMLSLDKTKETESLKSFLGDKTGILSWKLDGLTVVLTYEDGELKKAVTRGNGLVGEVITGNAKVFKNLPVKIPFKGQLIIRGEAVIKYSDFNRINSELEDVDAKYKNPRNLCAGSVRQLSNEITQKRSVNFYAFALIKADGAEFNNSILRQFEWLSEQGFQVVEHRMVTSDDIEENVAYFAEKIKDYELPSDGLVLMFDDIEYGESLGATSKFPRNGIAFKWKDETAVTKLKEIEWSPSRTGLINPVAIFEPVELEGTTVSRASVHNISIMESLELGIGDEIEVYKANMIIPQIAENHTRSGSVQIPDNCPVCGGKTEIRNMNDAKSLYCINEECQAKKIKLYTHFVSRDAMNIDGLSEETLEKFIDRGYIKEFADIYHLNEYEEEIVEAKGFGRKSFENIISAIDNSRNTNVVRLLYSLGIMNIGLSNAKMICKEFDYDIEKIRNAQEEELTDIDGVGEVISDTFTEYFRSEDNNMKLDRLLKELKLEKMESGSSDQQVFSGVNFVITGKVMHFSNRNEVKEKIEELGGKVTGSVTSKTNYLINNDSTSNSSKNKKAKELGIRIITEDEFIQMLP